MAQRPTLHRAVEKTKNTARNYNDNFDMMMDFIDNTQTETKGYVNGFMPTQTGQGGSFLKTDGTTAEWVDLLGILYPVGGLYITGYSSDVCPIANLMPNTTWEKVASGRVLQGADDTHPAGTTIAAGLPNIYGFFDGLENPATIGGAFYKSGAASKAGAQGEGDYVIHFSASRSSSIYGQNDTVQPPAYVVEIWRRTA